MLKIQGMSIHSVRNKTCPPRRLAVRVQDPTRPLSTGTRRRLGGLVKTNKQVQGTEAGEWEPMRAGMAASTQTSNQERSVIDHDKGKGKKGKRHETRE